MCVYVWCHAVFCVENSTISHGNKSLHVKRCGISHGIYTPIYMTRVIYMARLVPVEVSYTIHENDYFVTRQVTIIL